MLSSCQMINDDLAGMENDLEFFSDFQPKKQLKQPCNFTPYWLVVWCLWEWEDWWLCGCGAHICSDTEIALHDVHPALAQACYHRPSIRPFNTQSLVHMHSQTIWCLHSVVHSKTYSNYAQQNTHTRSVTNTSSRHIHLASAHRSQEPPLPSLQWNPGIMSNHSVFILPCVTVHYPHHLPCSHRPSHLGPSHFCLTWLITLRSGPCWHTLLRAWSVLNYIVCAPPSRIEKVTVCNHVNQCVFTICNQLWL